MKEKEKLEMPRFQQKKYFSNNQQNTHLEISALNSLDPLNIECMETAEETSHLFVKSKKRKKERKNNTILTNFFSLN